MAHEKERLKAVEAKVAKWSKQRAEEWRVIFNELFNDPKSFGMTAATAAEHAYKLVAARVKAVAKTAKKKAGSALGKASERVKCLCTESKHPKLPMGSAWPDCKACHGLGWVTIRDRGRGVGNVVKRPARLRGTCVRFGRVCKT
jgi:hypothetical protein